LSHSTKIEQIETNTRKIKVRKRNNNNNKNNNNKKQQQKNNNNNNNNNNTKASCQSDSKRNQRCICLPFLIFLSEASSTEMGSNDNHVNTEHDDEDEQVGTPLLESSPRRVCSKTWWQGMIPACVILLMLGFTWYTVVFAVACPILSEYPHYKNIAWTGLVCFHFYFLLSLVCFFAVIFLDPGKVPPQFANENGEQTSNFCQPCKAYKPERSHHCSRCKRCVLRMDHHCPWVNNCIGWGNVKAFVLMAMYFPMLSITACMFIIVRLAVIGFEGQEQHPDQIVCMALTLALGVLVIVLITTFGMNHCHLIFNNLTSLEYWQAKKQIDEAERNYTTRMV